jgi:N-acetylmuramoyl-L-alanine amidase
MKIISCPSPNFDERADGQKPSMIIIHYTGTQTAEEARLRFCDGAPSDSIGRISPHYMIGEHAEIYKFVDEDKRAWHAGRASWGNCTDINSASIGIEIWNTGHEYNFEEFIPAQIDTLIELIKYIRTRWNIPNKNILGHSDVALGRKLDPGEKFPWHKLAEAGIGVMPRNTDSIKLEVSNFFNKLRDYGYTYTDDKHILLSEFRRHYLPHLLNKNGVTDEDIQAIKYLENYR